ncbi:hypothetical protein EZH22_23265 [Xanthobacter dioxanivorans]|uniref:Uncharacterized protein n=1 Tax=Xanthobacter dioxanivorans TaxID=2528964 RepID=A0A974PLT2_9HYPH|nr:hypothetical protein [Xanthobacter dioxanivorans]QRG05909.1 hypothetical protein EZH22_23265 [Xanthobacter dioxanivorans]
MAEIAKGGTPADGRGARDPAVAADEGLKEPVDVAGEGRKFRLMGRLIALAIIASTVLWLVVVVPQSDVEASFDLSTVAEHMLAGEGYPPELLAEIDASVAPVVEANICDFRGLRNLAIVRVARVETAIRTSDDPEAAERRLNEAADAATRSLVCNPASTVSWTILAWTEYIRNDDTPRLRALLDMSFRTGPYEAWALLRRVELLLHLFPSLDASAVAQLRSQLDWLLAQGGAEVLAEHYVNSGPAQQTFLRELLTTAAERDQKRVAEIIRSRGGDIVLPFVEPLGSRPWK